MISSTIPAAPLPASDVNHFGGGHDRARHYRPRHHRCTITIASPVVRGGVRKGYDPWARHGEPFGEPFGELGAGFSATVAAGSAAGSPTIVLQNFFAISENQKQFKAIGMGFIAKTMRI